jgi:hypothetical protein
MLWVQGGIFGGGGVGAIFLHQINSFLNCIAGLLSHCGASWLRSCFLKHLAQRVPVCNKKQEALKMSSIDTLSEMFSLAQHDVRQEIADELKIDSELINPGIQADVFVKRGIVLDLHVARARFQQSLELEDVGLAMVGVELPLAEGYRDYLRTLALGRRSLIAPRFKESMNRLSCIESRARAALARRSFPICWGQSVIHFVPVEAYHALRGELEHHKREYFEAVEVLVSKMEEIAAATREMLTSAAPEIYRALQKGTQNLNLGLGDFCDMFVAAAMREFPSLSEARSSAVFDVRISLPPFGMGAKMPTADKKMLKDLKESLVEQKNEFVRTVIAHLNTVVHDVAVSAAACLNKHGTLLGPNVKALNEAFAAFDALNTVTGDKALAEKFSALRSMVGERTRDVGSVAQVLSELREATGKTLELLGQAPRLKRGADTGAAASVLPAADYRRLRRPSEQPIDAESAPAADFRRLRQAGGV